MKSGRAAVATRLAAPVAAAALAQLLPAASSWRCLRNRYVPRLAGVGKATHLALTFDDGPDPVSTLAFLDALDGLGWRATFFMLGEMAAAYPDVAQEVARRGHEVAVHGYAHSSHLGHGPRWATHDMQAARDTLADLTGARPRWVRPPYGALSTSTLIAARRTALVPVLWTTWGRDSARGGNVRIDRGRHLLDARPWRDRAAPRLGLYVRPGELEGNAGRPPLVGPELGGSRTVSWPAGRTRPVEVSGPRAQSRPHQAPLGSGVVDQAKVAFLFGQTPDWADPDNPEDRGGLLSELFDDDEEMSRARLALYETVANQVANDDPPEVWKTAQRLLGLGLERKKVLSDLVLAMVPQVIAGVAESQPYDYAAHKAALAALPLPGAEEVVVAMISVVREHQPVASDEVRRMAAEMLKIPVDQEPHKTFIECALDQAVEDEDLEFATGSLVIEPSSFFAGAVLTHRVTDDERDDGYLPIGVDLTLFEQAEFARGTGGVELEDFWSEDAGLAWRGPKGWLDPFPVGAVFAATANEDGTAISIEALAMPPPVDDAAVAALRAAYDECVEEIDLPVPIRQLALTLLTKDGHFFDEPRAPIRELIAAAGLERRDDEVAHSPEIWRRDDELRQYQRVIARFDDLDDADAALSVITLFNEGDWDDAHRMRQALSVLLEDAMGAGVVAGELLGPELEESAEIAAQAALAARFAERLLAVARKPTELAVARWLMGLADERSGDVLGAEAQLHIAVEVSGDWARPWTASLGTSRTRAKPMRRRGSGGASAWTKMTPACLTWDLQP